MDDINKKEEHRLLVQQEIYRAITYFLERQQLVAQAMHALGLDLEEVGKWGAIAWVSRLEIDKKPQFDINRNVLSKSQEILNVAKRANERNVSQLGIWNNNDEKWEYFLHGKGCRLRNPHSGEIINWNCPNVLAFDPYFFLHHLEWRIEAHYKDEELQYIKGWIKQNLGDINSIIVLIKEMIESGLINRDFTLPHMTKKD